MKKIIVTILLIAVFAVLSISISAGQLFTQEKEISLGIIDVDDNPVTFDATGSGLSDEEIAKIINEANEDDLDEVFAPQEAPLEDVSIAPISKADDTITTSSNENAAICKYEYVGNASDKNIRLTSVTNKKTATNLTIGYTTDGLNVVAIGDRAFEGCTALTTVNLSGSRITTIGQSAFHGCTALTTVEFPADEYISNIGGYAFLTTPWLKSQRKHADQALVVVNGILIDGITAKGEVTISSNNIKSIAPYAFAYNANMTKLTIANTSPIDSLPYRAFTGCTGLKEVSIDSVPTIGSHAFYDCETVEKLTLANVTKINAAAFNKCLALKTVDFGSSMETIESNAFANCKSIESLTMPDTLKTVQTAAFLNCTGLKTLVLSEKAGVTTTIGQGTFMGCTKLATITIPQSVTEIGKGAFLSCPVTTINFSGTESQLNHLYTFGDGVNIVVPEP